MNVIDSSAWLSYFAADGNADQFSVAIEKTNKLVVPSITIMEVFKNILRQRNEESALAAVAHMQQGQVINLDENLTIGAAVIGIKFKLPLADSIIYATAQKYNAIVWTQDADFAGLENVQYFEKVK